MATRTPAIRRSIEIELPVAGSAPGAAAADRTSEAGADGVTAGDVTTGGTTPESCTGGAGGSVGGGATGAT